MPSEKIVQKHRQSRFFQDIMTNELDKNHKLYKLKQLINWNGLEERMAPFINIGKLGRGRKDIRTMLGISLLQAMYNFSDKRSSEMFGENNYWQYFCGYEYFEPQSGVSESSVLRFRQALGEEGHKIILEELADLALRTGLVKKKDLESVIVDTTVQIKNIKHPHDVHLMETARSHLVVLCKNLGIKLNDSFALRFKRTTIQIWKYKGESASKKKKKLMRHMKSLLGRLIRAAERKIVEQKIILDEAASKILDKCRKIKDQSVLSSSQKKAYKDAGNKVLYSFHAEEVECIGKGKLRKPYEFGNKVSIAVSGHGNFVIGVQSFHNNPYDGHTLKEAIIDVEKMTKIEPSKIFVDLGYRGNNYSKKGSVYTPYTRKSLSKDDNKMQKRRSAIEPVIGHLKQYGRMGRNFLKGIIGDVVNPIISAIGFNLRSLANRLTKIPPIHV